MSHNILFPGTEEDWDDVWHIIQDLNSSYAYTLEYHSPPPFQIPQATPISGFCGIGPGPGVPPGDPDVSNSALSATPARNGIFLNWTYPSTNPHLVAFTEIYRSTTNDFGGAGVIGRNSADNYTDELENDQKGVRFFYWIRHVSIHGTWGDPVGPASAVWNGSIDDILEQLNNRIDNSKLDKHLREGISRITDLTSGLSEEEQNRLLGDSYLTQAIAEITADLDRIDTRVGTAITELIDDNRALALKVEVVLAQFNGSIAAVFVETFALAEANRVVAGRVTTVEGALTDPLTGDLYVVSVQEQKLVQLGIKYETHDGQIDNLLGQWSIKIDANGYVSGIGLLSGSKYSEFIVNADVFAIGPPEGDHLYDQEGNRMPFARPFIVLQEWVGGQLVNTIGMDANVYIRHGTVKNAQIGEFIQSDDWKFTSDDNFKGWRIDKGGNAWFDNVVARGDIEATSIKAGSAEIVNTLMLQDNAVTIPAAAGAMLTDQDIGSAVTLVSRSMTWGDPVGMPRAFIVNGLFGLNGSTINQTSSPAGTASIYLTATFVRPNGTISNHEYGGYGQSFVKGHGGTVQGMWHVSPPGANFSSVTFRLSGACTSPRQGQRATLSVLGAKR